jgi:hypothetical protein
LFRRGKLFIRAGLVTILLVNLVLFQWTPAWSRDVATQSITITLAAPIFVILQIGSPGSTIDRVSFQVANLPGSGPVRGQSTGAYPVSIQTNGWLTSSGTVFVTADSSQPLNDGLGNSIPFNQISWLGSLQMPGGRFNGTVSQTVLQQSVGRRFNLQGSMDFFYDNTLYLPSGTYNGRVTYTLSVL